MYRVSRVARAVRLALAVGSIGLLAPQMVMAQTVTTVTGTVTVEGTGAPLSGIISAPQFNVTVQTNAEGRYTLRIPSVGANTSITITARALGHTPASKSVAVSGANITADFALKADALRLSDVIVTGTADGQARNKIPFSVTRVGEEALKQVPASSPVAALAGKVAGARIGFGTGNPGAAPSIRLRGSTSLGIGNSNPLIIVDGVITRNSLADLDAQDIESIEVLKGAAASAFYGSDAANGVLAITTRRGANIRDGSVRMSIRSEAGSSGLQRWVPLNRSHPYLLDANGDYVLTGGARTLDPDGLMDNPYPASGDLRWRNQLKEWINDGSFYSNNFQLGFRRGPTNFNSSFTSDANSGLMPGRSGQTRQSARINVDQQINAKADFGASVTYSVNNNDYDPGSTAGWFALLQSPPDVNLRRPDPAQAEYWPVLPAFAASSRGNPLHQLFNEEYTLRRERLLASATLRYRPLSWLRVEGTYGTDRSNRRNETFQDKGYTTSTGIPGGGLLNIGYAGDVAENIQGSAVATRTFFGNLLSTTRAVYLYEAQTTDNITASGNVLGVKGTQDLDNVPNENNSIGSGRTERYAVNYFISQSFDYKDRYILDVLARRDGSSLFGSNNRWANFYRVAAAWRFTEDFKIPGVQDARVRFARGTAGLRPNFLDQYQTFSLSNGNPTAAVQVGNADLKPAIQTENEIGLNVAFLDRFEAEAVYSERQTVGAFLSIPLSGAQSGGFQFQVRNGADVSAQTFELSLNATVLEGANYSYSVGLVGDRTRQQIDRLGRAPFPQSIGQGQDVFYYKEGERLGVMYGTRFIRTTQELEASRLDPALYVRNPDGYMVLATQRGTATERPVIFIDTLNNTTNVKIGDVNPDFSWGLTQTARYGAFQLYALIDGVQGGDVYNMTKQWMYQDQRHGSLDQAGRPLAERTHLSFYEVGLYNGLNPANHYVENGTYMRLRELSVSYTVPQALVSRTGMFAQGVKVSLVGRNLFTWTNYSGFDPEANAGGDFNFRIDGFRYPNFRTVTAMIELNF